MAHPRLMPAVALPILVTIAAGCASAPPSSPSIPQVLDQVSRSGLTKAGEIIEQSLKERETFGYVAPFAPVLLPPEIRRVWVLTHVGPDGSLVSGHWVYVRLHDWRWFLETEAASLRLGAVPAAAPAASPPSEGSPGRGTERGPAAEPPHLPWVEEPRGEGTPLQVKEGGKFTEEPATSPNPQPAPRRGGGSP